MFGAFPRWDAATAAAVLLLAVVVWLPEPSPVYAACGTPGTPPCPPKPREDAYQHTETAPDAHSYSHQHRHADRHRHAHCHGHPM